MSETCVSGLSATTLQKSFLQRLGVTTSACQWQEQALLTVIAAPKDSTAAGAAEESYCTDLDTSGKYESLLHYSM